MLFKNISKQEIKVGNYINFDSNFNANKDISVYVNYNPINVLTVAKSEIPIKLKYEYGINKIDNFTYKFDYSPSKNYEIYNVVFWKEKLYICKLDNINIYPDNEEYWEILEIINSDKYVVIYDKYSKKILNIRNKDIEINNRLPQNKVIYDNKFVIINYNDLNLINKNEPLIALIKMPKLIGKFSEILRLDKLDGFITEHSNLYGLRLSPDRKQIYGVIIFTERKSFVIRTSLNQTFLIEIIPEYIERIL